MWTLAQKLEFTNNHSESSHTMFARHLLRIELHHHLIYGTQTERTCTLVLKHLPRWGNGSFLLVSIWIYHVQILNSWEKVCPNQCGLLCSPLPPAFYNSSPAKLKLAFPEPFYGSFSWSIQIFSINTKGFKNTSLQRETPFRQRKGRL